MSKPIPTITKYTCSICNRNLEDQRNYYKTKNPRFAHIGHLDVCKTCVKEYYSNAYLKLGNTRKAIIATMAYLGLPMDERSISEYDEEAIQSVEDSILVFSSFITANNGVNSKLLTRDDFDYVSLVDLAYPNSNAVVNENTGKSEEKMYIKSSKYDIQIDDDVIMFFGEGFTESQYKILLREYLKLAQSYSASSVVDELNFKEIAFFSLKIAEAKAGNVPEKDIISLVDARRKLLVDAKIQNKKQESEAVMGLSAMIKKMEFTRPASDPLPEWDESKLRELEVMIAGHLLSSNNIQTELTREYDELVQEYGVEDFINEVSEE